MISNIGQDKIRKVRMYFSPETNRCDPNRLFLIFFLPPS